MRNGSNNWNVSYGRITWLQEILLSHQNITSLSRHDDIIMELTRVKGCPITLICLDEYTLGIAGVHRVIKEFPAVNFISVGGNWNGYTREAKDLCLSRQMGLYNSGEITGAIYKNDFWKYHKKDDEGNPEYPYK
ncbi:hypothetical protein ABRP29_11430 [Pseudomonas sp. WHRI 8822A]|uniref:hypothetical protein n=1 Tax=Pseudomonas sp. WHRI 8822A TaxID=3162568 RepID=UPI0032EB29AD